ncbi:hypothetical protein STRIC_1087 [Streptococcus ictaluri 707-05]|uniref:Uncharacterized protein n=1 Tax=Streptococcus ictaluri 707-05 TaxID=764299 RepID=G5K2S0_9STRE|nr:hypothetical protein STRIC_1087 [Streptococcus ictaluri 707-05]
MKLTSTMGKSILFLSEDIKNLKTVLVVLRFFDLTNYI